MPLAGAERAAFLDRECAGDPALRARLEALLAAHDQPDTLFGTQADAVRPTISLDLAHDLADDLAGEIIGRYKLLEKIGEGGCGVVYVADQTEPVRRRVALKIIKLGMDTKQVVARFEAERQALAMMDHPNIAKVLDAGTTDGGKFEVRKSKYEGSPMSESRSTKLGVSTSTFDLRPSDFHLRPSPSDLRTSNAPLPCGRPYFVMELVRGIRITDYCDREQLSTRDRLDLFIKVCQAIQHAHQKGIIHRDIKPSNILVTLHDGVPVPKVIDFGIAKAVEGRLTDATVYTQLHQFIGTPAYMSPEQAEMSGLDIDTRSDIYSLGVLLYELLTGSTPFDAKELMSQGIDAMRRTIREKEPPRPSTRLRQSALAAGSPKKSRLTDHRSRITNLASLPADLDWIVMKCLEKDRGRRYDTANGLAADLKRHLNNEPVVARPPTAAYRFQKAFRRNKLVFAAASAVAAALVVGLGVSTWQWMRAKQAEVERGEQAELAIKERDKAKRAEEEARDHARQARRAAYAAEINVAFQALQANALDRARELLDRQRPNEGEEDLRGFEWRHLWQLCLGDELDTLANAAAEAVAYSPDGQFLVHGRQSVVVRDAGSRRIRTTLTTPGTTLVFSPDSRLLATGAESGVKLWDTGNWQWVRTLADAQEPVSFSPDGRWLLTGIRGGCRIWNTGTWTPLGDVPGAPPLRFASRYAHTFAPDSMSFVTVAGDLWPGGDHYRVWQLPGLERLLSLRPQVAEPASAAYSADGERLVAGLWGGHSLVWELASGDVVGSRRPHTGWIRTMAMAPDHKSFATASADRTILIWDATTFEPVTRRRGHVNEVLSVAYSPDGKELASASYDGTVKIWSGMARDTSPGLNGPGTVAGFTSDGRALAVFMTNSLCLWTPETGERKYHPLPPSPIPILEGNWGRPARVKPGEPVAVRGRLDGVIEVWDLSNGAKVDEWSAHTNAVRSVAFSTDGRLLVTSDAAGGLKVWDFRTRRELSRTELIGGYLYATAVSPDDRFLASAYGTNGVWLHEIETGKGTQLYWPDAEPEDEVPDIAFTPDGKFLVSCGMTIAKARVWEMPSGREVAVLGGHVQGMNSIAISPDGKTLATGSTDRTVKLWSLVSFRELATIHVPQPIPLLDFSPDGRMLAVSDLSAVGKGVTILLAPTFEEIAPVQARDEIATQAHQ